MNPIPGRISLLSSESSGFAQIGILAIPQGQILILGCGTSSCSSKIGLVSWFGSSDSGIFGGSSCILGGVICLCEPPDCCSASWGLSGDVIIYHASLLAESRKNCHYFRIAICLTWGPMGQNFWLSRLARRRLGRGVQPVSPFANSKFLPLLNGSWFCLHWPPSTIRPSGVNRPKFPANPLSSDPGKSWSVELESLLVLICSTLKVLHMTNTGATMRKNKTLSRHMDIGCIMWQKGQCRENGWCSKLLKV